MGQCDRVVAKGSCHRCLSSSETEKIEGTVADERCRAASVLTRSKHQMTETGHHGDRAAAGLALDQVSCRCELVGDGGDGYRQRIPLRVASAAQVLARRHTRASDRQVGLPVAPRPAHRVGHQHRDVHPDQLGDALTEEPRRLIGVDREQHDGSCRGVGGIHSGSGHNEAMAGLGNHRIAPGGKRADRLCGYRLTPAPLCDPALGLAHHLAGDDRDVAIGKVAGVRQQPYEVVTGGDLRPLDRPDPQLRTHCVSHDGARQPGLARRPRGGGTGGGCSCTRGRLGW